MLHFSSHEASHVQEFAAEALGISGIGVIVGPADYNKVDADDYLFSDDGEA